VLLDFTHRQFALLLGTLRRLGYRFDSFARLDNDARAGALVMLRHDVDRFAARSVALARIEAELGCRATYFFRVRNEQMPAAAIERVVELGHEIGYHYEDLADAGGDRARAWDGFRRNLDRLRTIAPVVSIAMHGRPFSPWDGRDLWSTYDYRSVGVTCEAYLDPDWQRWRYFTDTGRAWNGSANVRDTPPSAQACPRLPEGTTAALIRYLDAKPERVIVSAHPERWVHGSVAWLQVLLLDLGIAVLKRTAVACGVRAGDRARTA
jgi:hypothetical protein